MGHLADQANQGLRFCPYGRPIKCELVFTMDSSNTGTPIIALVVEPVYNNGLLVIPAGTELHGTARVDTIRDRICSTSNWVMVLPRDNGKANGRQLSVVGEMLDREEPDANGMTWGLLDGSFGLRGHSIHSMEMEEVKRFVATFMAAGSAALEERETNSNGNSRIASSARNAALEGLSSNLSEIANRISDEIAKNGVFIRVTGGKQFYFYPKQAISPDIAETPVPRITTGIAGSTAMDSSAGEGSSRKRKNPNPPAAKTAFLSPAPETSLLDEP